MVGLSTQFKVEIGKYIQSTGLGRLYIVPHVYRIMHVALCESKFERKGSTRVMGVAIILLTYS